MRFTRNTPLHRPVVAEEPEYVVTVPESLQPVFDALAKGVMAASEAIARELTPFVQVMAPYLEAMARANRRTQPREKPHTTRKMQRLSSVRRRVLAYRREQVRR